MTVDTSYTSASDAEVATPACGTLGTVTTCNTAEKDGDCWVWELTVTSELRIEDVTMRLHPTFKPNVVSMTRSSTGTFTSGELRGWGTFPVNLQLATCGEMHAVEHMLCFDVPETVFTHELSPSTIFCRGRRPSAERASATWRPTRPLDAAEAKRQKQVLKELRQAQRDLERSQRRGKAASGMGSSTSVTEGDAPARSGSKRKASAIEKQDTSKLTAQEKATVHTTARALLESISELAKAGDAAGVAKACALLHEDCIEAFSEIEGEDDGIREFAENAIQEYADFVTRAQPSPEDLRQLGARAVAGFLQRTFER